MNQTLSPSTEQSQPNSLFFKPVASAFTLSSGREAVVDEHGVWRNRLGLESTEEHRHVAKIWQNKCIRFMDFYDHVSQDAKLKRDRLVDSKDIRLTDNLRLATFTQSGAIRQKSDLSRAFTPNGMSTLLTAVEMIGTTLDYLVRQGESATAARLINQEFAKGEVDPRTGDYNGKKRFVRMRGDGRGGQVVRAVVSERYSVIDHKDVLDMVTSAIPRGAIDDVLVSHLQYDGDYMCTNLILPDYIKDPRNRGYGSMLQLRNSEIGRSCFEFTGGLFEAICLNGCVWGLQELSIELEQRHFGDVDKSELKRKVKRIYDLVVTMGNDMAAQAEYLTEVKLKDPNTTMIMLGDEFKMSGEQIKSWIEGYRVTLDEPGGGNESTAFGVWNGLTRGAQQFRGDVRLGMEQKAGTLLAPSRTPNRDAVLNLWSDIKDRSEMTIKRRDFVERREKLVGAISSN